MITLNQWRAKLQEELSPNNINTDFSQLRTLFIPQPNTRLRHEITTDYEKEMSNAVETVKEEFAKMSAKPNANFKADVPADLAKKFTIQLMDIVLNLILPQSNDEKFVSLRKLAATNRIPIPPGLLSTLRGTAIRLKNKYAQDYHISDWQETVPEVKNFAANMLNAVLKAVFPAEEVSGARNVNIKPKPQPRQPEQTIEPPVAMEV